MTLAYKLKTTKDYITGEPHSQGTILVYSISYSRRESFELYVISYQDNKMDPECNT